MSVIEDFPYAGMDFRNDVSLALPEGAQWDALGTLSPILNLFVIILKCFSNVFWYTSGSKMSSFYVTDVGSVRPQGMSVLDHRGSRPIREVEAGGIRDIEANLAALMMDIPNTSMEEVPYHL